MFSEAVNLYRSGKLDAARDVCRSILAQQAEHAHALHLAGVIAMQQGDLAGAERRIRLALESSPEEANFHNTLGAILRQQGRSEQAQSCLEKCVKLAPENTEAVYNLANLLKEQGEAEQAGQLYRQVLARQPQYHSARLNLAFLLHEQGGLDKAEACFREGLTQGGEMAPRFLLGLGRVLFDQLRHEEAEQCFRQVLQMRPRDADAYFYLGNTLHVCGLVSEAEACHRKGLEHCPGYSQAWNNLGNDLRDQGRMTEACGAYRHAILLKPDYMRAHSNLLLALQYNNRDALDIWTENRRWAGVHANGLLPDAPAFENEPNPCRKLRIGYVSADFHQHSAAYFIEPILVHHDSAAVEVICYSDVAQPDAVSARLRSQADIWREIRGMNDAQAADIIRRDRVDILVDLAGHTSHHRLLAFARKPAPVQVSYIGYPATTGMKAMDYRLTDSWADLPGQGRYHSEALIRLPRGFLCYAPPADAPPVAPPPCLERGYISFGSFNHLSKVTPEVIALWARILRRLPDARILLKHISLQDEKTRDRYLGLFTNHGVASGRVRILKWSATASSHLSCYSQVDIALDTFPYNGTTTSCEALWMGVPVVALAGKMHAGRVGVSLLNSAGMHDWAADHADDYIDLALDMASRPKRLAKLRGGLRKQMAASALCDGVAMAQALEEAYRAMWQTWCRDQQEA